MKRGYGCTVAAPMYAQSLRAGVVLLADTAAEPAPIPYVGRIP